MKKCIPICTLSLMLLFSNLLSAQQHASLTQEQLHALLSAQNRPKDDASRDATRRPAKVMAFSEIAPGDHVLDLFAGEGWYSELFSTAVGVKGKVYAQNDAVIWRFAEKGLTERTKNNRLPNVVRFDNQSIVDMQIADNSLDLVFTALNYHDLFFTQTVQNGEKVQLRDDIVDYKAALARIKLAMKEDGLFVIIDHVAHPGSGYEAANNLHRIDPAIVQFQMDEAGFKLVEEAFYLRNSADDLSKLVFDPAVRGKTDRFIYKYVKQ